MRALFMALTCCLTILTVHEVQAGPSPARDEINALLDRLQASGCHFDRNGSLHTGTEAKEHLLKKLAYMEKRGTVETTEQFIDLAASGSSSSGKPYLVKCANAAAVPSKAWLTDQLRLVRAPAGAASSPR
jgi:hypothetical protein